MDGTAVHRDRRERRSRAAPSGRARTTGWAIPLTAFQKTYGTQKSVTIYVKAGSAGPVLQEAGDEVRVLMRSQAARRAGAAGLV